MKTPSPAPDNSSNYELLKSNVEQARRALNGPMLAPARKQAEMQLQYAEERLRQYEANQETGANELIQGLSEVEAQLAGSLTSLQRRQIIAELNEVIYSFEAALKHDPNNQVVKAQLATCQRLLKKAQGQQ